MDSNLVSKEACQIKDNGVNHDKPFLVSVTKSKNLTQVKEVLNNFSIHCENKFFYCSYSLSLPVILQQSWMTPTFRLENSSWAKR